MYSHCSQWMTFFFSNSCETFSWICKLCVCSHIWYFSLFLIFLSFSVDVHVIIRKCTYCLHPNPQPNLHFSSDSLFMANLKGSESSIPELRYFRLISNYHILHYSLMQVTHTFKKPYKMNGENDKVKAFSVYFVALLLFATSTHIHERKPNIGKRFQYEKMHINNIV